VIWEDHFYPEIIHPLTGEVMPEGEAGELVFTSLTKEAMPVIRYRTRDLTRLLPPTARAMRRMDKIVGRSDDMMIIRGVNVFPSQIEELLLQQPALAPHYQILLTRNLHLDQMEVLVETREEIRHGDGVRGGAQLEQMIKSYIGISCTVTVLPPNGVERTQVGKARRVIDKRMQSV
jgi:phenylacetate-CoA ligase